MTVSSSFLTFSFLFRNIQKINNIPQKCQDPLLSHLQPLSPGRAHMELKRYYSICQDTALGRPGFQEGGGELKKEGRTRNSLSPTMAPKLSLEVRKLSNGRLSTSLKLGPLQPRGVPLREKKATQMLVIVLGESGWVELGWVGLSWVRWNLVELAMGTKLTTFSRNWKSIDCNIYKCL